MKSRPKILDEILFFILERAKCEENTDKYLEHVLDYCKKDYKQVYKKQNGVDLTVNKLQQKFKSQMRQD